MLRLLLPVLLPPPLLMPLRLLGLLGLLSLLPVLLLPPAEVKSGSSRKRLRALCAPVFACTAAPADMLRPCCGSSSSTSTKLSSPPPPFPECPPLDSFAVGDALPSLLLL